MTDHKDYVFESEETKWKRKQLLHLALLGVTDDLLDREMSLDDVHNLGKEDVDRYYEQYLINKRIDYLEIISRKHEGLLGKCEVRIKKIEKNAFSNDFWNPFYGYHDCLS